MKDIVSMVVESCSEADSLEQKKIRFCEKLLEELGKMTGEELAPHLDEAVFDKNRAKTVITLSF